MEQEGAVRFCPVLSWARRLVDRIHGFEVIGQYVIRRYHETRVQFPAGLPFYIGETMNKQQKEFDIIHSKWIELVGKDYPNDSFIDMGLEFTAWMIEREEQLGL